VEGVKNIRKTLRKVLQVSPNDRSAGDHLLVLALMSQRNFFKDVVCQSWGKFEFNQICKKVNVLCVRPFAPACQLTAVVSSYTDAQLDRRQLWGVHMYSLAMTLFVI